MRLTRTQYITAKYLSITIVLLLLLWGFTQTTVYENIQQALADLIDWIANREGLVGGALGLFVLGLIANTSILVQVPYSIPLMNIAFVSDNVFNLFLLSIATGAGAGIGEINSYLIARGLTIPIDSPEDSSFYRWIRRTIHEHPRTIPWIVFLLSASVLPDDAIIWPLAIVKYPVRKILAPMFIGKILHNFILALLAFYSVQWIDTDNASVRVDFTVAILIIFVMFILYQIELNRATKASTNSESSAD